MTQAHTRSEDMYAPLEDYAPRLNSWDSNYMPRVAYSAVTNGSKDGAVWQDQTNMAVYYSEFNPDGTHNRTLSLPNDNNERLMSATSDGSGAIVYGLSKTRETSDTALTMPVRLVRYDVNSDTLIITKLLDSSTPSGDAQDGLDVKNVGDTPSKLAWSGDRIGLNITRTRTDGHQSGLAVVYDANTLDLVKNQLQISGHQFGSTMMVDSQGNFNTLVLGDNFPRGIDLIQWNETDRHIIDLLRIKTEHATSQGIGEVYTAISTPEQTYYTWSNDNRTYSELGGVVEMDDRLLSFMTSERGLNNAEVGSGHNKARNIAVVATAKNGAESKYLTFGEYESTEFYNFYGFIRTLENRHAVWITDFTDINDSVSRLKPLKLADNVILLLMEMHTFEGYDYSAYMMVNKDLQVLVPLTRMHQDVIFARSDELRVENGVAYGYSSENGQLQRFTISLNGDPSIDTDNDGYGDYYEQLQGSDPNDPNSPLLNAAIDTDNDGIPNHMDYDDDADGVADIDDADPLDPNTDYDGDGLPDGYETQAGLNPYDNSDSETDSDNDGLRDALELAWNLNPYDATDGAIVDSDGDGFINKVEISANTDPLDPNAYDGDLDGVHGIMIPMITIHFLTVISTPLPISLKPNMDWIHSTAAMLI
ncbi:internalin putative [Vibrio ponticus]|nr:internalin putative [Vibrio ponticus]